MKKSALLKRVSKIIESKGIKITKISVKENKCCECGCKIENNEDCCDSCKNK